MGLIDQLNAATEYYWLQVEPEDILNKASALLWKLMDKAIRLGNWEIQPGETVDGGLMVKVALEYQLSHHGSYGKDTVIEQSKKKLVDAARFRWAGAYGANTLNLDDLTQNSGDEAVVRLTKLYMANIKKAVRVDMAQQVIAAAADDDSINGLGDLFNTTTSTEYGSIAEDDMPQWKANVITDAEAISFAVMQKIFRQPGFGGYAGTRPNFCCTTEVLVDGYERSLHPQQRYKEGAMVEAGWDNILHKGAPIVADPYYSAGVLDALNLNFLYLRSHKDYNFTTPEWVAKKEGGQPDTITANTRWRGNLFCTNRQMHVRHTNLTEPS
ncbi:MAG: phage major capsid protein [Deltaproteobacteria bacterium]|nr:phage major capsid protein [Deltaproteobacteria bacterium]